jgi:hypothetical protein
MVMNGPVVFNKYTSIPSDLSQTLRSTSLNLTAHKRMSFGAICPKGRASNEIGVKNIEFFYANP